MLKRNDVDVIAMADPDKQMMARAQKIVSKFGKKALLNTVMVMKITRIF